MTEQTSEQQSVVEKRRHERYSCNLRMTYTILSSLDSTPFEYGVAHSKDLSEAGVCIYTEHNIKVPILMQLNINLPMRPFHLLILAKALRSKKMPDSNLHEVGLKFVGILPPEFKRLVSEISPPLADSTETGDEANLESGEAENGTI